MNWYVLHVKTGAERTVRDVLLDMGVPARVPIEVVQELKGGRWRQREKLLFPSYVFLGCEMLTDKLYYAAQEPPEVYRFLGHPPQPITRLEVEYLDWLSPAFGAPLIPSVVAFGKDGYQVKEGPLVRLEPLIIKMSKRQRRAKVRLPMLGEEKLITFSIVPEGGDAQHEQPPVE